MFHLVRSFGLLAWLWVGFNPSVSLSQEPPKKEVPEPELITIKVKAVDPDGKPMAGVNIFKSIWTDEPGFKNNLDVETDESGIALVTLPKTYSIARLWASKQGYMQLFANWETEEIVQGVTVPDGYTFKMEPAVSITGTVVDEAGKPVPEAKIVAYLDQGDKPEKSDGRVSYQNTLTTSQQPAVTDKAGQFTIHGVPTRKGVELSFNVNHPDYMPSDWIHTAKQKEITVEQLLAGTAKLVLKAGVILQGTVTDPAGKPMPRRS